MKTIFTLLFIGLIFTASSVAQDDLLSLLGPEEETTEYIDASFKTNRVVNLHSLENTSAGVLDFKISHRFGFLSGGFYELFGLDNATIRLGFDYGITDRLAVGVGRSSLEKAYDGYLKYKILRQSKGKRNMPLTVALFASAAIQTLKWAEPERDNLFSSRLYYTFQLIMGRKFSERISFQLSPTVVHRNLVATKEEKNDVYGLGVGARIKLTKRVALNGEYTYVLPDQLAEGFNNGLSLGFDIETGGHVFQLHFTNSTGMIEKAFFTENTGKWSNGDIHFGFNISRVFTVKRKKE
jgi:opacity protein-like surface antigen